MTDSLSNFLRDLPDGTPQYRYVNRHDVCEKTESRKAALKDSDTSSPFLVFLDMPGEEFRESTSPEFRVLPLPNCLFTYSHTLNCMTLKITPPTHKAASDATAALFEKKISEMGLYSSLQRPGPVAKTYGDITRQPDAQWLPSVPGEDPSKPTVFLEIALAETQARMENIAKRWLTFPDSPLMLIILVKVYDFPKVVVQILGAYRKPQFSMAGMAQESVITRSNDITQVERSLVLPFEFIFWREKRTENPNEQDVVFNEQDLGSLAETIWRTQGFV